ncbi:MAG: hypothetical protein JWR42_1637 [Marmoricola sp.]|nr:hypothetical protein [Marmoricola sp.]
MTEPQQRTPRETAPEKSSEGNSRARRSRKKSGDEYNGEGRYKPLAVPAVAGTPARRETSRLSADLPVADAAVLDELARETGTNKVTALVRALRIMRELVTAEREGGVLTIQHADGSRERLRFL